MDAGMDMIQKLIVAGPVAGLRPPRTTEMVSVDGTKMGGKGRGCLVIIRKISSAGLPNGLARRMHMVYLINNRIC